MSTRFLTKLSLFLFIIAISCLQPDDIEIPSNDFVASPPEGEIIGISAVISMYDQALAAGETELSFDPEVNLYTEGYVVSSDEGGNWFEELILQDNPENPTAGIKVLIDVNPLYTRFEKGRKVYVKLSGLTVADSNGVLGIGVGGGNFIEKLPPTAVESQNSNPDFLRIFRADEVAEIIPKEVSLAQIISSGDDFEFENLFIRLTDVQFTRNDVLREPPVTFAAEATDEFDGDRVLESCSGGSIIVQTSTFSDFKGLFLPSGRGNIDAILSRDFFDEYFTLVINEPVDIHFDNTEERCDPDFTSCDTPSGGGDSIFEQDFEEIDELSELEAFGWTNINTSGGDTLWELGSFSGNSYAQITAFSSGEDSIEAWLITPAIDLNVTQQEELLFDIQASFDNGVGLSVLFSDNFTGDPSTADWNLLDAFIPSGPSGGFGSFETVGPINISCLEGTGHFAFLYSGSESGVSTRYHLDNIEITGI